MADQKRGGFTAVPSAKPGDGFQSRPTTTQNPPREQLPPLSSLFDTPPLQGRPAQSPYTDRPSPVFPAVSPLDARHPATPIHADRPYETSYFHRPSNSHPYSYMSKPEQIGRPGHQMPQLPSPVGRRPESPRYEQRYPPSEPSRSSQSSIINSWSPQSQPRPDYFSRDTSSSFRTHSDQHRQPPPPPLQRSEVDPKSAYRDSHASAPMNYPPAPASTVAGDPGAKDTLGPKIWSGTHFFPRFVRQAEVPGEGLCYFYDDGTHCKTVIDGEAVNAHWGVTKAGKPRKRLAIACITCREKKIKCDPDFPRCVQCEKFGRVCKFKNAPRGSQGSPESPPPAEIEDTSPRPPSSRADGESDKAEKHDLSQSVSPRNMRQSTSEPDGHNAKRQRNDLNNFTPVGPELSPGLSLEEAHRASPSPWTKPAVKTVDNTLLQEWLVNPYKVNPARTAELLSLFFKHVPENAACMLPEGPFRAWMLSTSEKSLDDLMLIYTILTLGTIFSSKPEHKELGVRFSAISRHACDSRHYSIQLVQARLILSVYYFALNQPDEAWDFCGGAMRAASGMKLNVEIDQTKDATLTTFPFGLNRHGYAECRRRTFWACYLVDRQNGLGSSHPIGGNSNDVFLRLPCDSPSFEAQAEVDNAFFDPTTTPHREIGSTIGVLSYLVNVTAIWGDVMANIYRIAQSRTPVAGSSKFLAFHNDATRRLREWRDSLNPCFVFSPENLKKAAASGKLGTYITMHTVYHTTWMKLNRYVPTALLNEAQRAHHLSVAKHHAEETLKIINVLAARQPSMPSPEANQTDLYLPRELSSPFAGHAILSAIDILTQRVQTAAVPRVLESFHGAQATLVELTVFWHLARLQQAQVLQRFRELQEGSTGPTARDTGDGYFEMREPIDQTFPRDYDCIYC